MSAGRNEGSSSWLVQEIRRLTSLASSHGYGGTALQAAMEAVHEDLGPYLDCGPDALEILIGDVAAASELRDEARVHMTIMARQAGRAHGR